MSRVRKVRHLLLPIIQFETLKIGQHQPSLHQNDLIKSIRHRGFICLYTANAAMYQQFDRLRYNKSLQYQQVVL